MVLEPPGVPSTPDAASDAAHAAAHVYAAADANNPPSSPSKSKVGRCRLAPGCPRVARAWFQRLKLKYDETLSNFALNFNLRRYS